MYRSAQVANDSLHPFRTEQGIQQMRCNEKTYEKEIIQTCKYRRSSRDARNLKHKKCQRGKKTLNFRHNVFKLKPGCNLNSLQDGKQTVTQFKRNQVLSWEKRIQNHGCTNRFRILSKMSLGIGVLDSWSQSKAIHYTAGPTAGCRWHNST